jgi:predicted amidophosphoribosyltransferase
VSRLLADLADLVLPVDCAGCGSDADTLRLGFCTGCVQTLAVLRPVPVRPDPPPAGLPRCLALSGYDGVIREALLAYKERGRHRLARPLGRLLADVVAQAGGIRPALLIPVPATSRAVRQRHGDHLDRLTRHAVDRLRAAGRSAVAAQPLRAMPRPDSATLDSVGRAAAADHAFRLRPARVPGLVRMAHGRSVVLVDDIITTGATLAAVTRLLAAVGVMVDAAAVLAATRRHHSP